MEMPPACLITSDEQTVQELEVDRRILHRPGSVQDVLDVGCGRGRLVNFLARQNQKRVVGLGLSSGGFAEVVKEADEAGISHLVECVKGDAQHMTVFTDGQFEAVSLRLPCITSKPRRPLCRRSIGCSGLGERS